MLPPHPPANAPSRRRYEGQIDGLAAEEPLLAERLTQLAVFADRACVPLTVMRALWAAPAAASAAAAAPLLDDRLLDDVLLDEGDARETLERLVSEHLIVPRAEAPRHDHPLDRPLDRPAAAVGPPAALDRSLGPAPPLALAHMPPRAPPLVPPLAPPLAPPHHLPGRLAPPGFNGPSFDLLEPLGAYLRCRAKPRLAELHVRLLASCHVAHIDATQAYWSPETFLHHLQAAAGALPPGALPRVASLNLGNIYTVDCLGGDHPLADWASRLSSAALVPGETRTIGDDGVSALAAAIRLGVLPSLTELLLDGNHVADAGLAALSDALLPAALPALLTLNLAHNRLTDDGVDALCTRLGAGALPALVTLDLSHNHIACAGAAALGKALCRGGLLHLAVLDLRANEVADGGLLELIGALRRPPPAAAASRAAPRPREIRELRLSGNPFSQVGLAALAAATLEGALPPRVVFLAPDDNARLEELLIHLRPPTKPAHEKPAQQPSSRSARRRPRGMPRGLPKAIRV